MKKTLIAIMLCALILPVFPSYSQDSDDQVIMMQLSPEELAQIQNGDPRVRLENFNLSNIQQQSNNPEINEQVERLLQSYMNQVSPDSDIQTTSHLSGENPDVTIGEIWNDELIQEVGNQSASNNRTTCSTQNNSQAQSNPQDELSPQQRVNVNREFQNLVNNLDENRNQYTNSQYRPVNTPFFMTGQVSPESNDLINVFIDYYSTSGKEVLQSAIRRFEQYYPHFRTEITSRNLPIEIAVLPIVLSSCNSTSVKDNKAGLWQITVELANQMNLRNDRFIDERMDYQLSTIAVLDHFVELKNSLQDFNLTIAAYIAGTPNVVSGIRQSRTMDFWQVASQNGFNQTAAEVVAQVYAVLHIMTNPAAYDFNPVQFDLLPFYETATLNDGYTIAQISAATNIPENILSRLNPQLKQNIVPIQYQDYPFKIPYGSQDVFVSWQTDLRFHQDREYSAHYQTENDNSSNQLSNQDNQNLYVRQTNPYNNINLDDTNSTQVAQNSNSQSSNQVHVLQQGETIYRLSVRYDVTVDSILQANGISDPTSLSIGSNIIIPNNSSNTQIAQESRTQQQNQNTARQSTNQNTNVYQSVQTRIYPQPTADDYNRGYMVYEIQPGDNLYRISLHYNINLDNLMEFNNMQNSNIVAGHRIRVPLSASR